jgi:RNA polymerase sigma-70 factor (ECF subfamily)
VVNQRGLAGINRVSVRGRSNIAGRLDPTTVDRARHGDLEAFEAIVRDRIGVVYRLTLAIVGNEADAADATQDTFVAAWRQIRRLRDESRLDAWLSRIAVNSARMLARTRRRRLVREIAGLGTEALEQRSTGDDPGARGTGDAQILGETLDRISPDQRTILALHHLDGRPIAEIATILDVPEGTAKSRLFAARRALAAALEKAEQ